MLQLTCFEHSEQEGVWLEVRVERRRPLGPAKPWEWALGFLRKPSKNFKQGGVMACFKNLSAMQRMNCKNENVETH